MTDPLKPRLRERVARRMCCQSWHGVEIGQKQYLVCDCVAWKDFSEQTDAAISEIASFLEEPTEEMQAEAARTEHRSKPIWIYLADARLDARLLGDAWRAMLRVTLRNT